MCKREERQAEWEIQGNKTHFFFKRARADDSADILDAELASSFVPIQKFNKDSNSSECCRLRTESSTL